MSLVTLMHYPEDERQAATFEFEHEQAHRLLSFQLLDPMIADPTVPASMWHVVHQWAHDTANTPINAILADTDLSKQGQREWWTFSNHDEHFLKQPFGF